MSRKEEAHNKGQSDRSAGKKASEPNSLFNILTSSIKSEDRMRDENKSYREGYNHTNSQKK